MASTSSSSSTAPRSQTRLYVGNLHFTVDEHTLIKIFSKYGKIAKLDFLFHKSGPMRGKPRGYCFIEFGDKNDALKALVALHEKPLRGRNLNVTFAEQSQNAEGGHQVSGGRSSSTSMINGERRTTLSMVKKQKAPQGTNNQIAALEAKLAQMKRDKEASESGSLSAGAGSGSSLLPAPPPSAGLPSKPIS